MTEELKKKVDRAIRLLQSIKADEIELSYSGGKDSDVILELAKMAGIKYRAIYKNTTIDPPYTIAHVKSKGVEIVRPKKTFATIVRENGLPSRYFRFCCKYLKEYKILDKSIQGISRQESIKRAKRYLEPTYCRVYSKTEKVEVFMPILEWTESDIKTFVDYYNIKCHPLYYDEKGEFHPERRLGCMCCPLSSREKRIEEFRKRPTMLRFYINNAQKYLSSHLNSKPAKYFNNAYEWMVQQLFYKDVGEFDLKCRGFFPVDCKQFLEDYFKVKL